MSELPLIEVEYIEPLPCTIDLFHRLLGTGDEVTDLLNAVFGPETPISGLSQPHPWVESQNGLNGPESAILEPVGGLPHGVMDGLDDDCGVRSVFRGLAAGDGDGAGSASPVSLIELVAEAFIGGFEAGVREGLLGARSTHSNGGPLRHGVSFRGDSGVSGSTYSNGGPLSHSGTDRSFSDQSRGL